MRALSREWRAAGARIGLVPTMGNLHRGHLQLVEQLAAQVDRLVVSIFVNPLQFGPSEDYTAYPRTLAADLEALAAYPVAAVLAPPVNEIYPAGALRTQIDVPALTNTLCGADRPGHFAGVAAVVTKLLNIVEPDLAIFGRKDYQQLQVVRQLVADLDLPTQIVAAATVREPDGLALSSRNQYLDPAQRRTAAALYATLRDLAETLTRGGARTTAEEVARWADLEVQGRQRLSAAGFDAVDYVAIRRSDDLAAPRGDEQQLVCLGAARLGRARLIDNVETGPLGRS